MTYGGLGREGGQSEDEVRAKLGDPAHRYERDDKEIWEYDHGPYRYYGYHLVFNASHTLEKIVQTRTEENVATIEPHKATRDDVHAIIGWPTHEYQIRGMTIWEWPMINKMGLPARLAVQFADDGTVDSLGIYLLSDGSAHSH
jgi:hypothetical protein